MTANQVAYWQLQEAKRHNVVDESQKKIQTDSDKQRKADQTRIENKRADAEIKEREASTRLKETQEKYVPLQAGAQVTSSAGQLLKGGASLAKLFL